LQQRINAFAKLRQQPEQMVSRDWRLIAWGLADECGRLGRAIDDAPLFSRILAEFSGRLEEQSLIRKIWFGLVSSYFSCNPEQGASSQHWLQLRALILKGLDDFRRGQRSERKWISVIEANRDVFSDTPGHSLGQALANNRMEALDEFRTYLHVPAESWFWRSVVEQQLKIISQLGDAEFLTRISPMLSFARTFPFAADTVLSGLLTRYQASSLHDQPHQALKELALERWGSPQIGSSRDRWSVSVGEDVCKMVMRWFAKEDLETFFKLLQGESGVDQDRLDYWLRFVGQIGFTRIVLGAQAWYDRSSDFVEFRNKNKGRISQLKGGTTEDNAFIMKIGSYVIVEFSKKGNACYFRPDDNNLPFQLNASILDLNGSLKKKSPGHDPQTHSPTQRGWWDKYDRWLAMRGISPDLSSTPLRRSVVRVAPVASSSPSATAIHQRAFKPEVKTGRVVQAVSREASMGSGAVRPLPPQRLVQAKPARRVDLSVDERISKAIAYARDNSVNFDTQDNRDKGGVFWFSFVRINYLMEKRLRELGFQFKPGRGYWID
jgi:hypothetical protein